MKNTPVLVVGHLCLDIIPGFPDTGVSLSHLLQPGKLVDITDAVLCTGGATSNTGLALHRLGFNAGIVGKIGNDIFGEIVMKILRQNGEGLVENMIISPSDGTSYSVVINPPNIDRMVLHASAANNTFVQADVPDSAMAGVKLMHFGYPPLMQQFYRNSGEELKTLFTRARNKGATTSLDMARPDPNGPSGKIDWVAFLQNVLPHTDIFLPSLDELIFMLDREMFDAIVAKAEHGNPVAQLDINTVSAIADRMLDMGTAITGFKLGDQGFYLKTTSDKQRLATMGGLSPTALDAWCNQEIITGCRQVVVAGTIGAGDCTIAGFLGGLINGLSADAAVAMAVAVGATCVEVRDANTGVPAWDTVVKRLDAGWPSTNCLLAPAHWQVTPAGNRRNA